MLAPKLVEPIYEDADFVISAQTPQGTRQHFLEEIRWVWPRVLVEEAECFPALRRYLGYRIGLCLSQEFVEQCAQHAFS